jgi:hypothetical protein
MWLGIDGLDGSHGYSSTAARDPCVHVARDSQTVRCMLQFIHPFVFLNEQDEPGTSKRTVLTVVGVEYAIGLQPPSVNVL